MGSRWQMEKKHDPYYKKAKKEDYRSRASYKIKQLDKKFKLIKEGDTVVESWSSSRRMVPGSFRKSWRRRSCNRSGFKQNKTFP